MGKAKRGGHDAWLKKVRGRREARVAREEQRIKDKLADELRRKKTRAAWEAMTPEEQEYQRRKRQHRPIGLLGMAALLGGRL